MDKQELIHTHALLAEIRNYADETETLDAETPEYDEMDVAPIALTATANDHEEAVFTLASELAESLTVEAEREVVPLTAD